MKRTGYILAILGLSVVCVGLGIALYFNTNTMSGHASNLEGVYQKSLYELIDNVNAIEVEVSKMLVSNDYDSQKKSLTNIKQQSTDAQNCLSYLPISSGIVSSSSKFMNQLSGYATSILNSSQTILNQEQEKTWQEIYDCIANLKYELNKISLKVSQGYSILENIDNNKEIDSFSQNFSGLTNDSIEYPSMIYDGPFSDGVLNQEIKGLGNELATQESAKEYLTQILKTFEVSEITYQGKTTGKFTTFNFIIRSNNITYYAQVTEQGKFLINLSGYVGEGDIVYSEESAIKTAESFANTLSLKNMKCVWKATSDNITYVNLAPVINGVIYYPDLIKVKIDRTNGNIMGWEATNYAYNHTERKLQTFEKTESEVLSNISSKISVNSLKKCLIPLEYGGESFAYEVCGKYNNFTYYIYIDATTGKQIKVMRVIQTTDGDLLL